MLCPNCDNVINSNGCQACGWKMGDPFPAHRMVIGSSHPLKPGVGIYPPHEGEPRVIQIVKDDPGATVTPLQASAIRVAPGFEAPAAQTPAPEVETIAPNQPAPAEPAPIPDPTNKTVQ